MPVKKKAAKKTYKPSAKKKTVPSLKRMSLEEYIAFRAEADAKMDARQAKTEASIDRLSDSLSAAHAKTEAAIDRLSAVQARTEAAFEKWEIAHAKTETAIDRLSAENRKTSVLVRELTRNMGGLNNSFGNHLRNSACITAS